MSKNRPDEIAREMFAAGATREEIMKQFGVTRQTVYIWLSDKLRRPAQLHRRREAVEGYQREIEARQLALAGGADAAQFTCIKCGAPSRMDGVYCSGKCRRSVQNALDYDRNRDRVRQRSSSKYKPRKHSHRGASFTESDKRTIFLSEEDWGRAMRLGDGNASAGIRRALKAYQN